MVCVYACVSAVHCDYMLFIVHICVHVFHVHVYLHPIHTAHYAPGAHPLCATLYMYTYTQYTLPTTHRGYPMCATWPFTGHIPTNLPCNHHCEGCGRPRGCVLHALPCIGVTYILFHYTCIALLLHALPCIGVTYTCTQHIPTSLQHIHLLTTQCTS